MTKRILFIVNVDWFFVSHRLPVAEAAIRAGYNVHLACAFTGEANHLSSLGITLHPLNLSRSGTGPIAESRSFIAIFNLLKQVQPDIAHFVTIKPILYGGIASRLLGVRNQVASVSGLGYVFVAKGWKAAMFRRMIARLYRLALRSRNTAVILQNPSDRDILIRNGIVSDQQAVMIRGSGVSLSDFHYEKEPGGVPVVTFASRLLMDKGVEEYVQSARILKERGVPVRFLLIGDADPDNPASISRKKIEAWRKSDLVEVLGYRKDIARYFAMSHIIVLPSYREGLPKVLVEAAASGRPVVTTDVPGCRDAIEPGKTGLLVPVRDAAALADAIQMLVEDSVLRQTMGRAGRRLAEREFAIEKIVSAHLTVYDQLMRKALCN